MIEIDGRVANRQCMIFVVCGKFYACIGKRRSNCIDLIKYHSGVSISYSGSYLTMLSYIYYLVCFVCACVASASKINIYSRYSTLGSDVFGGKTVQGKTGFSPTVFPLGFFRDR